MNFSVGDRIHFTGDNGGEAMCVYPGEAIYIDETNGDAAFANGPASIDRMAVLVARALYLSPAEIECIEVFADGSVEMLGDHSRSVMSKIMLDIVTRAKACKQ